MACLEEASLVEASLVVEEAFPAVAYPVLEAYLAVETLALLATQRLALRLRESPRTFG